MYIPSHYKNENLSEVKDFISANAFAILVNQVEGRPWATHTPLELGKDAEGHDILIGHIARANPQWRSFQAADEVLCIFNGPHSYVSSSWYHEEEVPTWNYVAVHIYGTLETMTEAEVLEWLHKLVASYEKNEKDPVALEHMAPATLRQVKGVVGFRITIKEIQAAYKLSQGREEDHPRITKELAAKKTPGSKEIGRLMEERAKGKQKS